MVSLIQLAILGLSLGLPVPEEGTDSAVSKEDPPPYWPKPRLLGEEEAKAKRSEEPVSKEDPPPYWPKPRLLGEGEEESSE